MSLELRWTEQAVNQLGAIAEHISLVSPIYAEQVIERLLARLRQAQEFPASGRFVPEMRRPNLRELIEAPYRIIYRVRPTVVEVIAILHGRQDLATHVSG